LQDADLIKVLSAQSIVVKFSDGETVSKRFTQIFNDLRDARKAQAN
jgi:hypothetical protein